MEKLVKEILKKGIKCTSVEIDENENLHYFFSGFSKSGTAELYFEEEKIKLKTRYNRIYVIENWDDFLLVAYDWYFNYKTREPFTEPDKDFLPHFLEKGLVKEIVTKKYV